MAFSFPHYPDVYLYRNINNTNVSRCIPIYLPSLWGYIVVTIPMYPQNVLPISTAPQGKGACNDRQGCLLRQIAWLRQELKFNVPEGQAAGLGA